MLVPLDRARRMLEAEDLAGLVLGSLPNVFYLTGMSKGPALAAAASGRLAAPALAVPVELTDFTLRGFDGVGPIVTYGYFPRAQAASPLAGLDAKMRDLSLAQRPEASLEDAASAALEAAGLTRGRIGHDGIAAPLIEALHRRYPETTWVDAAAFLRRLRAVKSPEEVRRMRRAAEVTEQAMREAAEGAKKGMTLREMAAAFDIAQIRLGGQVRGNHTSFGRATAYGMVNLDEQRLGPGDLIRFDVGCTFEGYSSDLARNYSFGQAPAAARSAYRVVAEALEHEVSLARPGIEARELFEKTIALVKPRLPDFERAHVGHGLGLTGVGYEVPLIGPNDATPLEAGMVLCLETPYYVLGLGGLHPEDMVVITESGCERLNPACPVEIQEVGA